MLVIDWTQNLPDSWRSHSPHEHPAAAAVSNVSPPGQWVGKKRLGDPISWSELALEIDPVCQEHPSG